MRILVVEGEQKLAGYVKRGLTERGHVVDVAPDGPDGLHLACEGQHDLVLLDAKVPGLDAIELLRSLRAHKQTPVIVLTADDRVEDRVRHLRAGADDCLVIPFAFTELLARIEAVARRGATPAEEGTVLSLGDLELDPVRRRAQRAGKRLDLTVQEFSLLHALLRHRGEVLSRTELTEQMWGMNFDLDSNVVEVAVSRLRTKLDDPFPDKLLHTVRGMGYVLERREPDPKATA
ncbi:MAG: winged helix-turn-helix domain-containing protein [Burkholderiaceae bacterium]|nr:winged helix-turn-helix domain-containing protein [Burkholderiaceae bacterium]